MTMGELARRLGFVDALIIGLGAMLGAGIFAAPAPAARAAGDALLVSLALALVVAALNASSVARLARHHPTSGGVYAYATARIGPRAGFVAGWCFVAGKLASCAAMASAFAHHAFPAYAKPVAVGAVVALTLVNLAGITKTALATRIILAVVVVALVIVVIAGHSVPNRAHADGAGFSARGILEGTALLFFAFAGYARIATLGEEVRDPERTIPRAMAASVVITGLVYAAVIASTLAALGVVAMGKSTQPLVDAVRIWRDVSRIESGADRGLFVHVVAAGAAVACLGVLLSLLTGIARTAFAMARDGWLPSAFARVSASKSVPHVAQASAGLVVAAAAAVVDLREAIGFSSCLVLTYYALGHASALRLPKEQRSLPRAVAALGLIACAVVAAAVPVRSLVVGVVVVAAGVALSHIRRSRAPR